MEYRKFAKYSFALLLALVTLVASLAPGTLVQAEQQNILRIEMNCIVSSFNPLQSQRDICQAVWFANLLYEPLILNLFNGSLVPWLAERWEILDNGTRYVFYIDKRARWSDGKPVTAHDVEVTWNQTFTYAFPVTLQGILEEVRAVDNYTVEFITTQPWARWYAEFGGTLVRPAHIWENLEDPLAYDL